MAQVEGTVDGKAPQSVDTANMFLLLVNQKFIIGRAQTMTNNTSYGTQGVYEIGSIMPQEHAFLRFTGTLDLNRIRLKDHALEQAGIVGLGEDILGTPIFNITTVDRYTGSPSIVYGKCSAATFNQDFRANNFVREQARFYYCYSKGYGGYASKYQAPPKKKYPQI